MGKAEEAVETMPGHANALHGLCSSCRGSSSSYAAVRLAWLGPCGARNAANAGVAQALRACCALRIHVPGPPSSLGAAGGGLMNQQAHSVTSACACFARLVAPRQECELAKLLRYQGSRSSSRAAGKEHNDCGVRAGRSVRPRLRARCCWQRRARQTCWSLSWPQNSTLAASAPRRYLQQTSRSRTYC